MICEICIDSVASARAAQLGGAKRVELCDNLIEGGTTPSVGMIQRILDELQVGVMVMIRPRGGDFLYDDDEFEVMKQNIRSVRDLPISGVVIGILKQDGHIDVERSRILVEEAGNIPVTYHRAFDMTPDPHKALDDIISTGAARLLTSGQEPTAYEGRSLIRQLVQKAGSDLIIMPGGGVDENNVKQLVSESGVSEVHFTGAIVRSSAMQYQNDKIYMGAEGLPEYQLKVSDPEKIRKIRELAESV